MNTFYKNLSLWLVILLVVLFLYHLFSVPQEPIQEILYSDFIGYVEKGEVQRIQIDKENVDGVFINQKTFHTVIPFQDPDLMPLLKKHKVAIKVLPSQETPWYTTLLLSWVPMLLLIGVWIFFMRQMQSGGGRAMSFGRSRAKLMTGQSVKVTFDDIAGVDEAKEELTETVAFLKDPKKFTRLGGRVPKGVLLVGPPGTGKTLLAKAIAGEADVPFFSISGSDFVEMFVGVGASRVRDLFLQAKKHAPCIIFIDEIDAVGRHRGAGLGGGHDEREQTLNQLLVEMDGFETTEGVIVVAATNRPDVLDPALLRPGRFDRQVTVPVPDVRGREAILQVHAREIPLADDVDLSLIARGTPGFSGADLENLVNEAALMAARENKDQVTMADFEAAKDKVLMGAERKSLILSEEEKRITAYHEAGHTLVAKLLPGTDPIHKVTIIPRGRALGLTQQLPVDERHTYPRSYLRNNLAILLGGRVAEELVLDESTTGAGNDIERASDLARKMVCEWGMSEALGPVSFGKREEHVFLGKDFGQVKDYSEATALKIDEEIQRTVNTAYRQAKELLSRNIEVLHALAGALLEHESLDGAAIDAIIQGHRGETGQPVEAKEADAS
ncbi:ATP-dependent metallopeptidase FtsH/Yme1/Tma family protein [Dissulfurirhabdus thermomarina]|uniref:ATP-dependent zinc metalloprotease FtsH n=1 Tax=Dissulfurirhabdus thermomarina TaxID=1765737 RepID=A0A6N9TNH1_DISTH|nr:ATP-dependent zinc metalloprotease FtsH [Dissulfurirhabdus thermomarina]NDY42842.1 ATP-dependent metallopeptidase FtsH/Yme1/Tma family protein [Dissulfurirhabdus thermomarina]NMX24239.1 ATP-dependent metallopeptidase FtsH/Yme1/Tma family protein [Dissulfurirhabdus thermomarina]